MKSRVLTFCSLDTPLARSQTQAVIDRVHEAMPRLTTQLTLLPSPCAETDAEEAFMAASRGDVEFLLQNLRDEKARLIVVEAADLGNLLTEDLALVCVPDRAPPFDAFLNRHGKIMDEMDPGATVGVMSQRSRARMQALWPDLKFRVLRGGVDRAMTTHMRRSEIDGLVLPAAVTEHLGIQGIVAEIYAPEFILPAPGQGILVVVGRAGDDEARRLLAELHSDDTTTELTAEQAFLRRMVPDLDMPVGALARVAGGAVTITGSTGAGRQNFAVSGGVEEAEKVGDGLAQQLLSREESFIELLEGEFPDGLPESDEDAELLESMDDDEDGADAALSDAALPDADLDDPDYLRGFEDLAGVGDDDLSGRDDDEEDYYEDER